MKPEDISNAVSSVYDAIEMALLAIGAQTGDEDLTFDDLTPEAKRRVLQLQKNLCSQMGITEETCGVTPGDCIVPSETFV